MSLKQQRGSILISIIIVVPFLILITASYMELASASLSLARRDQAQTLAQLASDAGADYALEKINEVADWSGTASEPGSQAGQLELHSENNTRTTLEVVVTNNSATSKTMTTIGRTFRPSSSTTPVFTKTVKIDLRSVTAGSYSIVTGVGGLYMSNSAKIVGGDVLVNGEISMSNTAQIGLSTNPVKVEVAHQNCPNPADANYPRLCNSGENGEPISITNSAHIYGSVKANNQTNGTAMSDPGLESGSVTPGAMPMHDRAAQVAAVANNQTGSDASCSGSTIKTWPANLKITGDVTISGSCKVTITGNVWITGNFEMSNSAQLLVDGTLGTTMPDIMVDGQTAKLSNSAAIISNADDTGVRLVNYWSKASCSPSCSNVTGIELYDSRNEETISLSNSASAPSSILYGRWTAVKLSNSGGVGAIIGQTVHLTNSATVTFGSSTAGASTTFWVVDGYRRDF